VLFVVIAVKIKNLEVITAGNTKRKKQQSIIYNISIELNI
jgi:hypothetical protein